MLWGFNIYVLINNDFWNKYHNDSIDEMKKRIKNKSNDSRKRVNNKKIMKIEKNNQITWKEN